MVDKKMNEQKEVSLFYKRIKEQAKSRGQSLNCVERNLGYPRNALNNYKHTRIPSAERLLDLSHYFNVMPEYLMGESTAPISLDSASYFENLTDSAKLQLFITSQTWVLDTFHKVLLQSINEQD